MSASRQAALPLIVTPLVDIGSNIATPRSNSNENRLSKTKFDSDSALCGELEEWIDEYQDKLPVCDDYASELIPA